MYVPIYIFTLSNERVLYYKRQVAEEAWHISYGGRHRIYVCKLKSVQYKKEHLCNYMRQAAATLTRQRAGALLYSELNSVYD